MSTTHKLSTLLTVRQGESIENDFHWQRFDDIRATANHLIGERNRNRPGREIPAVTQLQVEAVLRALAIECTPRTAEAITVEPDWPPKRE